MDRTGAQSSTAGRKRTPFSSKHLLSTIESSLLGPSPPTPVQRIELMHAMRSALPAFQSLLSYPGPNASDRAQVKEKEVRLPDSTPISLDDLDVQIALKLSDDLNLNEIECVRLLISTNQEWVLFGREPLEILRLAAGLWYTERRDLLTSLYSLLRAVLLDKSLEADVAADIQKYLEDLLHSGVRQRLISLIKELNREEPAGLGGPNAEPCVLDCRGALAERKAIVHRERLSLGQCLVFSVIIVPMSPKEVKDVFLVLKDCSVDLSNGDAPIKLQITFSLLFSLVIAFMSDALSSDPDKPSIIVRDASFRNELYELVMATDNNPDVQGFVDIVRLGWSVHLMLTQEESTAREMANVNSCLELICTHNVFWFLLVRVLQSTAYQSDDEDMICMYNAYMHKLMMCLVSHPLSREKVKGMKEKAMTALSPYRMSLSDDIKDKSGSKKNELPSANDQPFVSLMELIAEIYQKEPDLVPGNDDLWAFVTFAGEDHSNIQTLVAFLGMLSTLASSEEGAVRVFELLQGKIFRFIGWNTMFDCISIYEHKFKQALQNSGTVLPEFQTGDAKALVAYLNVLQKVVENGNPNERKNWFPDIEPLFKLLSYENVPPYLKGALRDAIAAFVQVSPVMKNTIWSYLEQYDLPVVVGPDGNGMQKISSQIYDMRFELNEVEAREERYPSTISFLNLLNSLIAKETDTSDQGRRFVGIFRFVYDHVFGPFAQRAYADPAEKWKLVIACLQHFQLILNLYDIKDEDIDIVVQLPQPQSKSSRVPLETQFPIVELMKDFMSGRIVFQNIMGILMLGVNTVIHDRTSQSYGLYLEKAVQLSFEILVLVLERDLFLSDFWRPFYQSLDVILSQDHRQIVTMLEYVRYSFHSQVQLCAIRIMSILSSRMVGLVQLLLKSGAARYLIEDYATCLELRLEESLVVENTKDDIGVLILQLLINNVSRPAPNITHLLLKFNMDTPIERTTLQPKFHYSCFKVILDSLETMAMPDSNALVYEFCFQLLYELCSDPLTGGSTMELLNSKRYQFFLKHLESIAVAPLPKRATNQALRISSLHQRAWLLKILALELHVADVSSSTHWDTCHDILAQVYSRGTNELQGVSNLAHIHPQDTHSIDNISINKRRVLELLEVIQFSSPDTKINYSQVISNLKYGLKVEDILKNSTSEKDSVYYYSERGDRLIDLGAFHDKLLQAQSNTFNSDVDMEALRLSIQQLLRLTWKYNKNIEEQAAQLHMLVGWSQLVEITISRRMSFLEDRCQLLFELLDSSLSASASPDCSLKMALILSQVSLTCMAKLRDERFSSPGGVDSDNITCLDLIMVKQLPSGACHSIFFKLVMSILRNDSSELLRRRQYALMLCYFQYCSSILDPDVPASILRFLLREELDEDDDMHLKKIDKEQADLARANFSMLKKEAHAILDVVMKDAIQGSESGKTVALYVLDAFIGIDEEIFFLSQFQSRGFLQTCLSDISSFTYQDSCRSLDSLQRLYTIETKLVILLRISHHYKKVGAEVLLSMGALDHLASSRIINCQFKGLPRNDYKIHNDLTVDSEKQRLVITSVLRLVSSLTALVELSDFFEVKNKIVREVVNFVKTQQSILDQILTAGIPKCDDIILEQINLVVSILSKVWPYEENDEYGFVQELFAIMCVLFSPDALPSTSIQSAENRKKELTMLQVMLNLSSYLYFLVRKKSMRLQVSDVRDGYGKPSGRPEPTLFSVVCLLTSATNVLERAAEEKSLLLNKIQDINELSRQEVDEIINMCMRQDHIMSSDHIGKRRYIAMVEMCHLAGNKEQLISLALRLVEHALNILMTHFQDDIIDSADGDHSLLCKRLLSTLERLEQLREDKVGQELKVFFRAVSLMKEMTIRHLAL